MRAEETESLTSTSSFPVKSTCSSKSNRIQLTSREKILILCLALSLLLVLALLMVLVFALTSPSLLPEQQAGCLHSGLLDLTSDGQTSVTPPNTLPEEEEEEEEEEEDLLLSAALAQKMSAKLTMAESDFRRRYPRGEDGHYRRRLLAYSMPRPSKLVSREEPLTQDEKVSELLSAMDMDSDGAADPWELQDWMVWVQTVVYKHQLDEQWTGLVDYNSSSSNEEELGWSDYQSMLNPYGIRDDAARRRRVKDRRRWILADSDKDESLTKHEFKYFIFPQLSPDSGTVLIHEAHADLDSDLDGKVSLAEFLAVVSRKEDGDEEEEEEEELEQEKKERYFSETLDEDKNGFLDLREIGDWVEPAGFVQAKSEVVFLMQELDSNGDKVLTREEIMGNVKPFVTSQVTFYGLIYRLKNLRAEVFQLERLRRRKKRSIL